jgi:DNA repair protein SbcC/Rad50
MKITFCADLHLNLSKYGKSNQDGLNFRTMDFLNAFEKTVDENISAVKPDYFCILGDIFENPNPQNNIREFFQNQVVKLVNANINTLILIGNHDICKHHHALQPIQPISKLNGISDKIHVFQEPSIMDKPDMPLFLMFPHPLSVERQEIGMREAFFNFCTQNKAVISKAQNQNRCIIFLGHFGVGGAKMNDGYLNKSQDSIQVKDLDVIGANYVLLGDYHVHQKLSTKKTEAFYVGSLERTDFSDLKSDKGFMVIDTDQPEKEQITFVKNNSVRPIVNFEGNLAEIQSFLKDNKDSFKDSITKIKFKGNAEEYKEFSNIKKDIRKQIESDDKAQHVLFAHDVKDEQQERKIQAIQKEIESTGYLDASDVSDIASQVVDELIPDQDEQTKTKNEITDIINAIKAQKIDRTVTSGSKSSVLVHAVKMHNFLRYGDGNNILEFDKGAKYFLELPKNTIATGGSSKKALEFFNEVTAKRDPRIITIVGMTDGDKRASNGSGKSTVFEAIAYGFYEKLVREYVRRPESKGPSTTSIVCEENGVRKKEAYVEILFSAENSLWLLKRGRKITKSGHSPILSLLCLTEGGSQNSKDPTVVASHSGHRTKDDNQTVLDLIKMSFDTFVNSIMYGQNDAGQFITGSDKIRKEIIINALQLGVIDDYLDECRKRKKLINDEIIATKSKIELMEQNSNVDVTQLEGQIKANLQEIAKIDETIAEMTKNLDELKQSSALSAHQHAIKEVELRQQLLKQKEQENANQKQSLLDQQKDINELLLKQKNDLTSVENDLSDNAKKQEKSQQIIKSFDEKENEKQLDLVKKAKEFKPIRTAEKQKLDAEKEELFGQLSIAKQNTNRSIKEVNDLKQKQKTLSEVGEIICSECKQPVTQEYVDNRLKEKNQEYSDCVKEQSRLESLQKPLLEKIQNLQLKINAIESQLSKESSLLVSLKEFNTNKEYLKDLEQSKLKLQSNQKTLQDYMKQQTTKIESVAKSITSIDQTFAKELKKLNEEYQNAILQKAKAESLATTVKTQIADAEKLLLEQSKRKESLVLDNAQYQSKIKDDAAKKVEVSKLKESLISIQKNQTRNAFIEGLLGINGIQTRLVDKYIPLLNSYVKDFIAIVSDNKIDVEIVTKDADGSKNGKLDIVISGDMSSDCFMASGGEGIKIKLAVSLGLGLLSFVRSDTSPEFIALDEVFSYVDEQTKDSIFMILEKLKERFRDIFVVSHDPTIVDRIQDTIVVNKVNGTSTIAKQYWER